MGLLDGIFDRDKDDKDKKDDRRADTAPPVRRADFSDVQGASETTAPSAGTARTYTVKAGDSLSRIAQRELGAADRWPAIYEANRDQISNPDLIHPGQVLTLPAN